MHFPISLIRVQRVVCLAVFLLMAGIVPRAFAQPDQRYLSTGARVRIVRAPGEAPFVGNVARVTPDSIAVGVGGGNVLVQLPLAHLASLEVSDGRDRTAWTSNGLKFGAIGGAVVTGLALGHEYPGSLVGFVGAFAGAIAGGFMGAIGGGVAGAILAPERWERVSIPSGAP